MFRRLTTGVPVRNGRLRATWQGRGSAHARRWLPWGDVPVPVQRTWRPTRLDSFPFAATAEPESSGFSAADLQILFQFFAHSVRRSGTDESLRSRLFGPYRRRNTAERSRAWRPWAREHGFTLLWEPQVWYWPRCAQSQANCRRRRRSAVLFSPRKLEASPKCVSSHEWSPQDIAQGWPQRLAVGCHHRTWTCSRSLHPRSPTFRSNPGTPDWHHWRSCSRGSGE